MTFAAPWALIGLLVLPLIWWLHKRLRRPPQVVLPSLMFLLDEAEARAESGGGDDESGIDFGSMLFELQARARLQRTGALVDADGEARLRPSSSACRGPRFASTVRSSVTCTPLPTGATTPRSA